MLKNYYEIDKIGHSLFGLDTPYTDINFYLRPENWSKPMHVHSFFQFLLVLEGELLVITGNDRAILKRGMVSIVPPELMHGLKTETGYKQFGVNLASNVPDNGLMQILSSSISTSIVLNMPGFLDFLPEIEDCSHIQTMLSIQKIRNRLEYMLLDCIETMQKQEGNQAFKVKLINYLQGNKIGRAHV